MEEDNVVYKQACTQCTFKDIKQNVTHNFLLKIKGAMQLAVPMNLEGYCAQWKETVPRRHHLTSFIYKKSCEKNRMGVVVSKDRITTQLYTVLGT